MTTKPTQRRSIVALATAFSGAAGVKFQLPEDLTVLSDAELSTLHTEALAAFDASYGDGTNLTNEALVELGALTDAVETLAGAVEARQTLASTNAEQAAEFAGRVKKAKDEKEAKDAEKHAAETAALAGKNDDEAATELAAQLESLGVEVVTGDQVEGDVLVASGKNGQKVSFRVPAGRTGADFAAAARMASSKGNMKDVAQITSEGLAGFASGAGVDFDDLGRALDSRLAGFNQTQYAAAAASGRSMRQLGSFAQFKRSIPADMVIKQDDREHVASVIARATDETRLQGGSLLASGGWHAPSEVLYREFLELESREGILGAPEIGVARGGVHITTGPDFAGLYKDISGFHFTEQNDIDGKYAKNAEGVAVDGTKPVYHVEPPEFKEYRLEVDGLIITSGLLAARGYPEHLARVIRGALVAHAHRLNAAYIGALAAGSTQITMAGNQAGAVAPLLTSIELQVEHYKTVARMRRGATLEAVFPFWVRGAIRSDLSRRLGVELLDVPDSRIDGWFRSRGISPTFVYDWQSIDLTTAQAFNAWPTEVSFLLYAAGTWVKGVSDILTLDTIYDSVLLGKNDYTALFTEEGWFAAKAGHDSRLVTTSISPTGATHIGAEITRNGSVAA
jgi:hypothetical protein